ncbi:MAG: peptidoglycan DD-metalloendopeptidase family protein [Actinomycetota bacterium]|nr:peptidoglycan DD-metalloendopeptidase family protein [Actinomycetota bacterium]
MSRSPRTRAARIGLLAVLLAASVVPTLSGAAIGDESLSGLKARMASIQAELDASAARITELEGAHHSVEGRIEEIEVRMGVLEKRSARLRKKAIERADALYRAGGVGMVEMLFDSSNFAELTERAEILSNVSLEDQSVFVELHRSKAELVALDDELSERQKELDSTIEAMDAEIAAAQERFVEVSADYEELKSKLMAVQPAPVPASGGSAPGPSGPPPSIHVSGNMTCPVAGPVSFVDSWGAPRAGHTHQGVDMMAGYGTPVVAITSGTITYAAYDGSGGNMIFMTGDDGHAYWYMHNQQNLVTSGRVAVGQQIATVGDTGNAEGSPHVHFEYHPGGGSAVNPYPLVASLC